MFFCVVTSGEIAICDVECVPSPVKQRRVIVFAKTVESHLPFIYFSISIAVTESCTALATRDGFVTFLISPVLRFIGRCNAVFGSTIHTVLVMKSRGMRRRCSSRNLFGFHVDLSVTCRNAQKSLCRLWQPTVAAIPVCARNFLRLHQDLVAETPPRESKQSQSCHPCHRSELGDSVSAAEIL